MYVPGQSWVHLKLCTGSELGAPEAVYRVIAGGTWNYVSGYSWEHLKLCTGSELGGPEAMNRVRGGGTWSYVPDQSWGHLKLHEFRLTLYGQEKHSLLCKWPLLWTQGRIPDRLLIGMWLYLKDDSEAWYFYTLSKTVWTGRERFLLGYFPLNSRSKVCLKLNCWLHFSTT